jgi:hypothetical protein
MTGIINVFDAVTKDSKTLKIIFASLGIAIIGAFAPLSATVIAATLLLGGLVKIFQYCYKEFKVFKITFDTLGQMIAGVFFYLTDTIKKFVDIIANTFKSFSTGIGNGLLNLITLVAHGLYEWLIYPLKMLLTVVSKIPKIGKMGQWGLDFLKDFEDKTFAYTFGNEENKNNGNNNNKASENKTTDYSSAIAGLGLDKHDNNSGNRYNNNGYNGIANNQTQTKSTLDININTPKQYNTSYSLNNPYNSGLAINVSGNQ